MGPVDTAKIGRRRVGAWLRGMLRDERPHLPPGGASPMARFLTLTERQEGGRQGCLAQSGDRSVWYPEVRRGFHGQIHCSSLVVVACLLPIARGLWRRLKSWTG